MLKIAVTNLGKYNEGELVYKWLELPASDEEIQEAFDAIGINEEYEEMFISDYESDYDIKVSEYENIKELNTLCERVDELHITDVPIFWKISENEHAESEDDYERVFDILNDGCFYSVTNEYELGEVMLENTEIPDFLQCYIDYEKYGRNMLMDYSGTIWTNEGVFLYN